MGKEPQKSKAERIKDYSAWFNEQYDWCNEKFYDEKLSVSKLSKYMGVQYDKLNRIKNGTAYPNNEEQRKIKYFFVELRYNGCLPPEKPDLSQYILEEEADLAIDMYAADEMNYETEAQMLEVSGIREGFKKFSEKAQGWILEFSDFLLAVRDYHLDFIDIMKTAPESRTKLVRSMLEEIPTFEGFLYDGFDLEDDELAHDCYMETFAINAILKAYIEWKDIPEEIFENRANETEEMALRMNKNQEDLEYKYYHVCYDLMNLGVDGFMDRTERILKTVNRHDVYNIFLLEKYFLHLGIATDNGKTKAVDYLIGLATGEIS